MLVASIKNILDEMNFLLGQLDSALYAAPHPELNHSTIGQHVRHVIEMFQCLIRQYDNGVVNYDLRERNSFIETLPCFAVRCINEIKEQLDRPEKPLILEQRIGVSKLRLHTNYYRELLYNMEHCIHHQALIRVVTQSIENLAVQKNFGVAQSTIDYKDQCAR